MDAQSNQQKLHLKELIAIGIGGMIGGGIFSVLGLAVQLSGHAAPLAFALGSMIAISAGYSYVKLALVFRSDGASFTYLEHAFPATPNLAGIAGWTVIVGYVGTLALYAFTFGAYGADLLGSPDVPQVRIMLSVAVLLFFMAVNMRGVAASGAAEDLVVYTKIILLGLFAILGLSHIHRENLQPVFDHGVLAVFNAGALIFVAYEGFQLITNGVSETAEPEKNIPRGIYSSILITSLIYILLAIVAVGSLTYDQIIAAKEYALAEAAGPALGDAGRILVAFAALLATSSAVNGTLFGAARMMAEMAVDEKMPRAFSIRNRTNVPWPAVLALTGLATAFTLQGSLEAIASFSSMTFLLVSIGVSMANLRLRKKTSSSLLWILTGLVLMLATVITMVIYLWNTQREILSMIAVIYLGVIIVELFFSKRRLIFRF